MMTMVIILGGILTGIFTATESAAIAVVWAIPLGVVSAVRQNSALDYLARVVSLSGLSLPLFVTGALILYGLGRVFRWMPPLEFVSFTENPLENLKQLIWPALCQAYYISAPISRLTRSEMLEVIRQDYVRTAWAKGLQERVVVMRHAVRNALIPVVTLIGLQAPLLIGGAVIIEQIFVLPGMGLMMLDAVNQRDYPVITGVFLVVGVSVMLINLLVDLSYGLLDPRVRHQ